MSSTSSLLAATPVRLTGQAYLLADITEEGGNDPWSVGPGTPVKKPDQWSEILPLFNITFYLENNGDVVGTGMDPLEHFLLYGREEGRMPNADFDMAFYMDMYPDVAASGLNPFLHYLVHGWQEGRMSSADNNFNELHPEVGSAAMQARALSLMQPTPQTPAPAEPVVAGALSGDLEALVVTDFYLGKYADVAKAGVDAFEHYMTHGWREDRDPNALFDTGYYLAQNADVAAADINPLEHYLRFGAMEQRDASALFDTSSYLARHADVAGAGMNPLFHYLQWGQAEGREIFPA